MALRRAAAPQVATDVACAASTIGVRFQFIFCILGLGMLASVVTAITELDIAEENVARAAVEALANEKLRRISETHSRGSMEHSTPPSRLSAPGLKQDAVDEAPYRGSTDSEVEDEPEPAETSAPVAPAAPPPEPAAVAQPMERQVPPSARFSAGEAGTPRSAAGAQPSVRHSASGPLPLPSPPADIRLRPTPPNSPPWFVQPAAGDPPQLRLTNGLVLQTFLARGAEERARARAERAARVAARRESHPEQGEEDVLHATAAHRHGRILSPAEWSDA